MAALTAILDASSLILAASDGSDLRPAKLAFAMVRHALIDLAQIFVSEPLPLTAPRLSAHDIDRLNSLLAASGLPELDAEGQRRLNLLRVSYEPYANALADFLLFSLPPWLPASGQLDDWQTPDEGE